jgi:hypothetical protein
MSASRHRKQARRAPAPAVKALCGAPNGSHRSVKERKNIELAHGQVLRASDVCARNLPMGKFLVAVQPYPALPCNLAVIRS